MVPNGNVCGFGVVHALTTSKSIAWAMVVDTTLAVLRDIPAVCNTTQAHLQIRQIASGTSSSQR